MLDQNVAYKWLEKNLRPLKYKFGLEDWDIRVHLTLAATSDNSAEVSIDGYHEFADISVYLPNMNTIQDLSETIAHELIHVVCAPYENVEEIITTLDLTDREKHIIGQQFLQAAELARCKIDKMLTRHLIDQQKKDNKKPRVSFVEDKTGSSDTEG